MKFDPEAGSLKTSGSERIIPLHPALIETGFLKFAAKTKAGPLFAALSPDKFGKRGGNGTKVIGRFVRQLGLTDTQTLVLVDELGRDFLDRTAPAMADDPLVGLWAELRTSISLARASSEETDTSLGKVVRDLVSFLTKSAVAERQWVARLLELLTNDANAVTSKRQADEFELAAASFETSAAVVCRRHRPSGCCRKDCSNASARIGIAHR